MKKSISHLFNLLFAGTILFLSCKKETTQTSLPNLPPIANAGEDKSYDWPGTGIINLDGGGTDADGTISTYRWFKLSGPNYLANKIYNPFIAKTFVLDLNPGMHQFQLTVTDNSGASAKDTVNISVIDTLTTTGKEYIFSNLQWEFDDEFTPIDYIFVGSQLLFYNPTRSMEVSVLIGNAFSWQTVEKSDRGFPYGAFSYSVSSAHLYVSRVPLPASDNLAGTSASIKVRFL